MSSNANGIVWFKRDLRLTDHLPLAEALARHDRPLLIYILEPRLLADPHYDVRHWRFVWQSLQEMKVQLSEYGRTLNIYYGEVDEVMSWLCSKQQIQSIYSHQETGLKVTFDRDKRMADFFDKRGITWKEYNQDGVFRGRSHRQTWMADWKRFIQEAIYQVNWPESTSKPVFLENRYLVPDDLISSWQTTPSPFQIGGSTYAWEYLKSFCQERSFKYMSSISSPSKSRKSCSRLSPYLAWGCISMREAYQYAKANLASSRNKSAFLDRMRWRSHFIQKFEMEDRMEFEHVNRGYNRVEYRQDDVGVKAWEEGRTGYPMVDACMKCLKATGYINFRMRAMLVSFLTHNLFVHWREGAHILARYFLDFEPGIHYSQFQMQAGVTGINTLRLYNPIKQSRDQDADGKFLAKWLPGWDELPLKFIHEPWKMTAMDRAWYGQDIPEVYFNPVVDPNNLGKASRDTLWAMRNDPEVVKEGFRIIRRLTNPGRSNERTSSRNI